MNPQHNHTTITLLVRIKSVTVIPFQIRNYDVEIPQVASSLSDQCEQKMEISIEPTKSDRSCDPHMTGSRQGEQRDRTDLQTVTVCFAKD